MTVLKSMVLCLALANVGYFLWVQGFARSQDAAALAVPAARLKLASEADDASPVAGTDAGAPAAAGGTSQESASDAPAATLLTDVRRCVTVGPFRDVAEASHAASTLRGGGYDPRQRVVDGEIWAGLWVYLAMPAGRPATEQLLAKLKAAGIDDALEMPGPADASVISLGLFSDQKRAQARLLQAQGLGLEPAVADRKRTGNVYWIDIDLKPTDGSLNAADLQSEAGHISRLQVKACPATASRP